MKYANTVGAARHLAKILEDPICASAHPFIQSLPESVRSGLLDPSDPLRRLLRTRSTKTNYASQVDGESDNVQVARVGPLGEAVTLNTQELDLLVELILGSGASEQQYDQLRGELYAKGDRNDGMVDVACVRWVLLPGRPSVSGKIWADTDTKVHGKTYYTLDAELGHGSSQFSGRIVELQNLLLIGEVVVAKVTYGRKKGRDPNTQCHMYSFQETDQSRSTDRLVLAERLKSYVHFANVRGILLLNRFYIPTS